MVRFHYTPPMFYVYKIINLLNNKFYIGKTSSLERRWSNHSTHPFCDKTKNECPKLYNAIRKYGISNFKLEVLFSFDVENEALLKEESLIKELNSIENGYNISPGGQGFKSGKDHPQFGKPIDLIIKEKISTSLKGHFVSEESKMKASNSLLGKGLGESNSNSKISNLDALEIKRLYLSGDFTQLELAKMFNIKRTSIQYIINVRLKKERQYVLEI